MHALLCHKKVISILILFQLEIQSPVIHFSLHFLHFSVNSLVEDLNKEPESNSVQMAVEETRGHLRAALPLSGDSYFNITQNMTCGKKYTVYG